MARSTGPAVFITSPRLNKLEAGAGGGLVVKRVSVSSWNEDEVKTFEEVTDETLEIVEVKIYEDTESSAPQTAELTINSTDWSTSGLGEEDDDPGYYVQGNLSNAVNLTPRSRITRSDVNQSWMSPRHKIGWDLKADLFTYYSDYARIEYGTTGTYYIYHEHYTEVRPGSPGSGRSYIMTKPLTIPNNASTLCVDARRNYYNAVSSTPTRETEIQLVSEDESTVYASQSVTSDSFSTFTFDVTSLRGLSIRVRTRIYHTATSTYNGYMYTTMSVKNIVIQDSSGNYLDVVDFNVDDNHLVKSDCVTSSNPLKFRSVNFTYDGHDIEGDYCVVLLTVDGSTWYYRDSSAWVEATGSTIDDKLASSTMTLTDLRNLTAEELAELGTGNSLGVAIKMTPEFDASTGQYSQCNIEKVVIEYEEVPRRRDATEEFSVEIQGRTAYITANKDYTNTTHVYLVYAPVEDV